MEYRTPESVPPEWEVGDLILDRYEVRQKFEGGGMGMVYRVYHREWKMELAVKAPRADFFQTTEQKENFEREAETWVNLGLHPNIVSCYYVRRLGGIPRLFAEFVEGGTLDNWIRDGRLYEGEPNARTLRVLNIAIQIAWALSYAHENGLVHQDVKPANILMMPDGTAKLTDFGLASAQRHLINGSAKSVSSGQSILVPGSGYLTPAYASPEQFRGTDLTPSSDIWSWALTVLEMMKGECDWLDGRFAPEVLQAHYGDIMDSDPISSLLSECFIAELATRPKSIQQLAERLTQIRLAGKGELSAGQPPPLVTFDAATLNNRMIAAIELDSDKPRLPEEFSVLQNRFPFFKVGRLNAILYEWAYLARPLSLTLESIDNIEQIPGRGLSWEAHDALKMRDLRGAQHRSLGQVGEKLSSIHRQLVNFFAEPPIVEDFLLEDQSKALFKRDVFSVISDDESDAQNREYGGARSEITVPSRITYGDGVEVFDLGKVSIAMETPELVGFTNITGLSESASKIAIFSLENTEADKPLFEIHVRVYDLQGQNLIRAAKRSFLKHEVHEIRRSRPVVAVTDDGALVHLWFHGTPTVRSGAYRVCVTFSGNVPSWSYEFRQPEPTLIEPDVAKLSGDGERLLLSGGGDVELWRLRNGHPLRCLLSLTISDFVYTQTQDDLFQAQGQSSDRWSITARLGFPLLVRLRSCESMMHTSSPFVVVKPTDVSRLTAVEEAIKEMGAAFLTSEHAWRAISGQIDALISDHMGDAKRLLDIKWQIACSRGNARPRCGWHVMTHDCYWDSPTIQITSSLPGEFVFCLSSGVSRYERASAALVSTPNNVSNVAVISEGQTAIVNESLTQTNSKLLARTPSGRATLLKQHAQVLWKNANTGITAEIWSEWDGLPDWAQKRLRKQEMDGTLRCLLNPSCWALSHCGKLIAFYFDSAVVVLDPGRRSQVMVWKIGYVVPIALCFDCSGRWLAFAHSGNVWEEFEFMWDAE